MEFLTDHYEMYRFKTEEEFLTDHYEMYRFKTEEEFKNEFGERWRGLNNKSVTWTPRMDKFFGQKIDIKRVIKPWGNGEFNYTDTDMSGASWSIIESMIIPIDGNYRIISKPCSSSNESCRLCDYGRRGFCNNGRIEMRMVEKDINEIQRKLVYKG